MCTDYEGDYSRVSWGGLHEKHIVATWKRKTGTIPAFALGPRKTKKTCVEMAGRRTFLLLTEERSSQLLHGGRLKSRKTQIDE
jgi:hypothetical protein